MRPLHRLLGYLRKSAFAGRRRSPPRASGEIKHWLFYAGPENYLSERGEIDFNRGKWHWSASPEVAMGDLVLLYRRSMARLTVDAIVEMTGMPERTAQELKRKPIGSDIAAIWEVVSGNRGPLGSWQASCMVRQLARIAPALTLAELKADRRLRAWKDLRWNFQAQGRDALEIPAFAWEVIKELISSRLDRPVPQLAD